MRSEKVQGIDPDVISYLEKDMIRNALDIWYLQHADKRYELHVSRVNGEVRAHLSTYNTPEAIYTNLGGELKAAEELFPLVPSKAVLMTSMTLGHLVTSKLKYDVSYVNDFMLVKRGEETLRNSDSAIRLSRKHDFEYSIFGSSFNVPPMPLEWIRECLNRDIIFGVLSEAKLASVASLVVWLPQVAVIMSVETKPEFRGRGLGSLVVSATVREALRRSESCILWVRSDNENAIGLYSALGFRKIGEELWIDIGTGLAP